MLFHGALFELPLFGTEEDDDGVIDVMASDSLVVALGEALDEIVPDVIVSDGLAVLIAEAISIFGEVSASDSLLPLVDDTLDIFGTVSASDQILAAIDDLALPLVLAAVADDIGVLLADESAIAAVVSVSDDVEVVLSDVIDDVLVSLARSDTLSIALFEYLSLTQWKRPKSAIGSIAGGGLRGGLRAVRPLGNVGAGSARGRLQ